MDKEKKAIGRIRLASAMSERYYKKSVLLCYSGGIKNHDYIDGQMSMFEEES